MEEDTFPYFSTTYFYQLQKKTKLFTYGTVLCQLPYGYLMLSEDRQGQQKTILCEPQYV